MKRTLIISLFALCSTLPHLSGADGPAPAAAPARVVPPLLPGEVRRDMPGTRIRGQLASVDLAHRTGTIRRVPDNEVVQFSVLPFATFYHHAAIADLADYKVGQWIAFYLCADADGLPTQLVTATDELHELFAHKGYYFITKIDAASGLIVCNRMHTGSPDIVWENMQLQTTPETRYWKAGQPAASFADLKAGMPIRTATLGGAGLIERTVCDVLLDDETLSQWQDEQVKLHEQRLRTEGIPGFVSEVKEAEISLTTFPEATEYIARRKGLPARSKVRIVKAGQDRRPVGEFAAGLVTAQKTPIVKNQYIGQVAVTLDKLPVTFKPTDLVRVFVDAN